MAIVDAILIQMPNINLNRRVILCSNQPVRGRAAFTFNSIPQMSNSPLLSTQKNTYPHTQNTKSIEFLIQQYHFLGM